MRAHPLPEARSYAELMLTELRKVIPSFLKRVDLDDRGVAWSALPASQPLGHGGSGRRLFGGSGRHRRPTDAGRPVVRLLDWDPDAEVKLVAAMLYPYTYRCPRTRSSAGCGPCRREDRLDVVRAYAGDRTNRRHRPGRALERLGYRFDVLSDYGAFRDLQRHRMLTIEWQDLTPDHGYTRPEAVDAAGGRRRVRRGHGALGQPVRSPGRAVRAGPGPLRRRPGLPGPLRHAAQRPRGHAPARAAHHAPGPSRVPPGGPGDAPADRGRGRPPRRWPR